MNQIEELQKLIDDAKNIVVLTGAGISTASGIPDIRSANGAANNKDLIKKYDAYHKGYNRTRGNK